MTDLINNWLPTKEACAICGLSEARLRALRDAGKLRHQKMGHISLYYREDIEAIAKQQTEKISKRLARKRPG